MIMKILTCQKMSRAKHPRVFVSIRILTDQNRVFASVPSKKIAGRVTQPAPIKLDTGEEKVSEDDLSTKPVSRPRIRINTEPKISNPETGVQTPDDDNSETPEKTVSRPRIRIQTQSLPDVEDDKADDADETPEPKTTPGTRIKLNMDSDAGDSKPRIKFNTEADPNADKQATSRIKLDTEGLSETRSTKPRIKLNLDSDTDDTPDKRATSRIKLDTEGLSETRSTKPRISLNLDDEKPESSQSGSSMRIKLDDMMNPETASDSDTDDVEDDAPDDET